MPAGIRVTVGFPAPANCPIAELSERGDTIITDLATSVGGRPPPVTEFLVETEAVPAEFEHDPVFTYTDREVYRIDHHTDCPCARLGEFETPIHRYDARAGTLELVFHAPAFDQLQAIVGELRDAFPGIDIKRLVRAPTAGAPRDTVFVDRGKLTERQRDVLETAYDRGYFDRPRGANATEIADALDITPSTFGEHLAAAQSKLVGDVLERGN